MFGLSVAVIPPLPTIGPTVSDLSLRPETVFTSLEVSINSISFIMAICYLPLSSVAALCSITVPTGTLITGARVVDGGTVATTTVVLRAYFARTTYSSLVVLVSFVCTLRPWC